MAVIVPPGQNGLEGQVAALQQQITELSRRSTSRPVCAYYLTSDFSIPNMADTMLGTGFTKLTDNLGMWTPGSTAYITIPFAGRWSIRLHVAFEDYCFGHRACKITKNGTSVTTANVIGSDARMANGDAGLATEGTIVEADVEWETFNQGDKLYFSCYQRNNGNTGVYGGDGRALNLRASSIMGKTVVICRYLGGI